MTGEAPIMLATAVQALREELTLAMTRSDDDQVQLALQNVELEMQVGVTRESGADAGIKFWVVGAGSKTSSGTAETHTIRLTLSPTGPDGGPIMLSDRGTSSNR